jgi:mono/diheme cytochrome c family protein
MQLGARQCRVLDLRGLGEPGFLTPMALMNGLLALTLVLVALSAHAQTRGANASARETKNPVAATPASITAGAAAFKKYCAFCHGADAKGNGPLAPKDSNPPDLTDATWEFGSTDGDIYAVIANGAGPDSKMVGFKRKMPEQDLWNIINYLRSIGPKPAAR